MATQDKSMRTPLKPGTSGSPVLPDTESTDERKRLQLAALTLMVAELMDEDFYGDLNLKLNSGLIVVCKKEQSIKIG
jgi:hypothetical protein